MTTAKATAKLYQFPTPAPVEQQSEPVQKIRERLTADRAKNATPPPAGSPHLYIRCAEHRGFGVCITSKGVRSWFVEARIDGQKRQTRRALGQLDRVTIEQAHKRYKKFIGAAANGVGISKRAEEIAARPRVGLPLKAAYAKYLSEKAAGGKPLRPATIVNYDYSIALLKDWHERDLWSITRADVSERFLKIKREHSLRVASEALGLIGWIWNYLGADLETTPNSPTLVLKRKGWLVPPDRRTGHLSTENLPHWWASLPAFSSFAPWDLYWRALLLTGCRRTEMLRTEWAWWDAEARTLTLPKTLTKGKRAHVIPIGPVLARMLEAHRKTQAEGTRFIFASPAGCPLTPPKNPMKRWRKKHGHLYRWSLHDLRRTYAKTAEKVVGMPAGALKQLMNHAKGDVTAGYIHYELPELRVYQEKMEAALVTMAGHTPRR